MNLKILLPSKVFEIVTGVKRIVAETGQGSFGILPNRLDCIAPLTPGILIYETADEGEVYIALDEGVLVKAQQEVLVSVRRASRGKDLSQLLDLVRQEFMVVDEEEQSIRSVMAKLESGFLHRFVSFKNG